VQKRRLGKSGPEVSALGLGCMGMSDLYGPVPREKCIATIHDALDAGLTILDTGDWYGTGHNELLIHEALQGRKREDVFIAVKFGVLRSPEGGVVGIDTRPAAVKNFLAHTLQRLGTDYVDLYQPSRLDPDVPIEDTVGAMSEMVEKGFVRHLGLSEVGVETLRRAHAVHPISQLQIEYSLFSRGIERSILPVTRELGVSIAAYGVLSRGLLSGHWSRERSDGAGREYRGHLPRFSGENLDKNLALVETLRSMASDIGATVAQLAIAWVLAQGDDILPLIGARRPERLKEALGALDVELTTEHLQRIETAVPEGSAAGQRYDAMGMSVLDSES
jgi:aryl-alcohol dehydrogenase-like predicted oxidoreductase